ncbi:MAG: methyl-accepting chemotaxis protein [Treponema sp.]|nr:methyl-accepting chemotaxis protein [Treponema sp.]
MKNMRVSAKLIVSFLIVGLLAVAVGGVGIFGMARIADSSYYKFEEVIKPMQNLSTAERTLITIRVHIREMVLASVSGDFALVETEFGIIESMFPVLDWNLTAYRASIEDQAVLRLFDEARAVYANNLLPVIMQLRAASQTADMPAILGWMELCRLYSERILAILAECLEIKVAGAQESLLRTVDLSQTLLVAIVTVLVFALAAIIFLTSYVSSTISKPIALLTTAFSHVADGDLTKRLPEEGNCEIAEASRSFNKTMEKLKRMILTIKNQSEKMSEIGNELANNMTETATAINQIAANIQNIQSHTVSQSASVIETHATMEQVAVYISKLNSHVENQSGEITQASSTIEQLVANTRSVTDALVRNDSNAKALMEASEVGRDGLRDVVADIQEIAHESEGLMEINSVMENIASQTNLLSMNAAIEAAHAGEAGKGFAVVADEIRKLAESSGEQSKTIGTVLQKIKLSIDKITRSTENVLSKFEAIDSSVKTVVEQEGNIRNAVEEQGIGGRQILESMNSVHETTRRVNDGSREMLEGAEEVIKESASLEKVTLEISSSMTEMASGAEQINLAVHHVNEISGKSREEIRTLMKEVSRFKVN